MSGSGMTRPEFALWFILGVLISIGADVHQAVHGGDDWVSHNGFTFISVAVMAWAVVLRKRTEREERT